MNRTSNAMKRKQLRRDLRRGLIALCAVLLCLLVLGGAAMAADGAETTGDSQNIVTDLLNSLGVDGATTTVELILLLTVLSLAPSILIMMTSFTRIIIVLSFTRSAMGTQAMPPNQVLIGLALFLTYFTMYGPLTEIGERAWKPYSNGEFEDVGQALTIATDVLRDFMLEQITLQENESDLVQFMNLARIEAPYDETELDKIPTHVIIPAFITSEIKTAFTMGLYIFIPFIVIDMVVASALMSMGMMMLPPVMISLPFKIMLFVMVGGWELIVSSVIRSFTG